jgi:hypothetical protein
MLYKITAMDIRLKQGTIIEFINDKGKTLILIYEHLKNVYRDLTAEFSTVRLWVHHCGEDEEDQTSLVDAK